MVTSFQYKNTYVATILSKVKFSIDFANNMQLFAISLSSCFQKRRANGETTSLNKLQVAESVIGT